MKALECGAVGGGYECLLLFALFAFYLWGMTVRSRHMQYSRGGDCRFAMLGGLDIPQHTTVLTDISQPSEEI